MPRRTQRVLAFLGVVALGLLAFRFWPRYPSNRTPEGAYLRVAKAVNLGHPEDFFAYLETAAQHAAYTIRDYRKRTRDRILSTYPDPERTRAAAEYGDVADAPDGQDVFAAFAVKRGWVGMLRRDLSGIARVEVQGERATVETVKGTRYPFRRRENGIWGLTLFTAVLVTEAERAARDSSRWWIRRPRTTSARDTDPRRDSSVGTVLGHAVALELAVQRLAIEAEHLRGERLVSADGFEHAEDVAALDLLHRDELRRDRRSRRPRRAAR